MKTFYLQAVSQFMCNSTVDNRTLKDQLKQKFSLTSRRTSRVTLLALLGGMPLKADLTSGVYVTSSFSSPSNMSELELQVFQHRTPKPFHFINSINNAVPFYIAQAQQLSGPTIFTASDRANWGQILLFAIADLQLGIIKQALIGWCHEASLPMADQREGSHWLLLSTHPENAIAKLTITDSVNSYQVQKQDYFYQDIAHLIDELEHKTTQQFFINLILNKIIVINLQR